MALPCPSLPPVTDFFAELGFRIEAVQPADDPAVIVMSGHGLRLRLERGGGGAPGVIYLRRPGAETTEERIAPNGTRVILAPLDPPIELPPPAPSLQIARLAEAAWVDGRAGMRYRDLIADRQGGRFIASHIHIAEGGEVPDYVHYHRIRLQLIYCVRGWVRVVYEDQGAPLSLEPGDAVLQPPELRHRVLECSADLEVVELSSPADHETRADHEMSLPGSARPVREYGGQRFALSRAAEGRRQPWRHPGFESRDLQITGATGGLARAEVVRFTGPAAGSFREQHGGELRFGYVLQGSAALVAGERHPLSAGDAFTIPPGLEHGLEEPSAGFEMLEITV